MPKWKKLKPLTKKDTVHIGCLNCSTACRGITMKRRIWGEHDSIIKDRELVYLVDPAEDFEDAPTLMTFENLARKDPDHDWRYYHLTALYDETYQRQGRNLWLLVKSGPGYA